MNASARAALWAVVAASCVPLAAFAWSLHPGLPAGDSAELITVAATHGVAHPPGYPLYAILGGLWLMLWPHTYAAWAMNLFSAVCMSAACGMLAAAVWRACGSWPAGVLAAWLFAACPPVFTNAIVAEVFGLHALLAAAALLAMVSAPATGAVALAYLSTLALSHHHTLVLLAVPACVACTVQALLEPGHRARRAAAIAGAALLGLLPLLWLPLAAGRPHALVWGDPTTLPGFLSLLLRAEYGTLRLDPLAAGFHHSGDQLDAFLRAVPGDVTWVAFPFALVGLWRLWMFRPAALGALAGYFALQAAFFTRVGFPTDVPWLKGVVERFHILPLLVLACLSGIGVAWSLARLARRSRPRGYAYAVVLTAVFALGAVRAPALQQRGNRLVETLGRGILASVPRRGVLFTRGDVEHNALGYLLLVEDFREDVVVVDQELMSYPWYMRRLRARHPGLLPAFDRAMRITFVDSTATHGVAVDRTDHTTDLLTERGQATVATSSIADVQTEAVTSLYDSTRATFPHGAWLEQGEDRYSGLPGTRNLLWFDQLSTVAAVGVLGVKDDSYTLRYALEPHGFVQLVRRSTQPADEQRILRAALAAIDAADPNVYFHAYPPTSLEITELPRFSGLVADAALLLSKAGASLDSTQWTRARWRVREFAARFEWLEPTPDAACLRAIGFLRVYDPAFRDAGAAKRDLQRALAAVLEPAADTDAQRVLQRLQQGAGAGEVRPR